MKRYATLSLLLAVTVLQAQELFKENNKWGIRTATATLVPAKYDTVLNFDQTGTVCMACFRKESKDKNKAFKSKLIAYSCNYLNKNNRRLIIRDGMGDTTSHFALGKKTHAQYAGPGRFMVVSSNGVKNLVTKDFKQLTFKGYHDVDTTADPNFYRCEFFDESETVFTGLIDKNERQIVPFKYSNVRVNTQDSIILACGAGLYNGLDDLYSYDGKRIASYSKHVEAANKKISIQTITQPATHFYVVDNASGKETQIDGEGAKLTADGKVEFHKKNAWFRFDPEKNETKPLKQ